MAKIRVGFICGKDTDFVEDPGKGPKYSAVGDPSFLAGFPDKWRVDPVSHEYLMDCPPGTKGQAHQDVALAWYVGKKCKDIEVDIITPADLSLERLASNDLNFTMGYNMVNISVEQSLPGHARMIEAFQKGTNIFPTWEAEKFILYKSNYLKALISADVPVAPTLFAFKGSRSAAKLLKDIKERGWKKFVMKQSTSGFCLGFCKLSVAECERKPKLLEEYFKDYAHIPEFIVQECIDGFTRNWETRVFFFNGKFQYAIANMAGVSTKDGKERIVTGDDIPREFFENAKRIGEQAVKVLPALKTAGGKSVDNVLVRVDIGCSDSQVYDKDFKWDPSKKTFFVNEIEPSSTTYFVRWLKFDSMPMMGRLYASKAREIYKHMKAAGATAADRMKAKAAKGKATTTSRAAPKAKAPTGKARVMKAGKVKAKAPSSAKSASKSAAKTPPKPAAPKPKAKTLTQAKAQKVTKPKAQAAKLVAKAGKVKSQKQAPDVRRKLQFA